MAENKLTLAQKKQWLINARDDDGVQMLEAVENELALRDARIDKLEAWLKELEAR